LDSSSITAICNGEQLTTTILTIRTEKLLTNAPMKIQGALGQHPKTSSKIIQEDNYSLNSTSRPPQITKQRVCTRWTP